MNRATLLLTRPEAQSLRFADAFRQRFGSDWPVVISPLTRFKQLNPDPVLKDMTDLIFTSENAVRAYVHLGGKSSGQAWCVGERTVQAARSAGFSTRSGPGDAAGLAQMIVASGAGRNMLWPRPVHAAFDIEKALNLAGIETISLIVYDQVACNPIPDAIALMASSTRVLLPLFSARSASIAGDAFADAKAAICVASISSNVAAASAMLPAKHRITAANPDATGMLDALALFTGADKTA